ncbi:MAG: lipocalin family protein [Acidobacteria bacterium]|nr:lipocalin family protein [Acidobacteriota bacterium]
MTLRLLIIAASTLGLAACTGGPSGRAKDAPPLQAVPSVDATRYAGLWYEIARYPNGFQKNCEGVTAEYTLRDDGRIGVLNTCRTGTKSGEPRDADGIAKPIDGSGGARLAVNFAPIPLPAGDGNYWVIYLDDAYAHAVVGEPSGRYLWYLSRTPTISPDVRARMDAAAEAQGYDLSMLKETIQP